MLKIEDMAIQSSLRQAESTELQEFTQTSEPEMSEPTNDHVYPSGARLVLVIIGLWLSLFLGALDSTILAQAIPSITETFSGLTNVVWYSTAYLISNTAFKMFWGKAYRNFRLKPTFLVSMLIFEAGNVLCATAQSSTALIIGRIVSGMGGAGLMCGSFVISALSVRSQYRPMMMGVTSFAFGLSSVTGPVLGGALVDALGWRWCFWINLPIGAVAAGIMIAFYRQITNNSTPELNLRQKILSMDINGSMIVGGSLVCFVLAMHWVGSLPWNSPQIIGSLVGFFSLTIAFAVNERLMGPKAMLRSKLLRNRNIVMNCTFALFFAGLFYPLTYILPIQFQSVGDESAAASGVRMIPFLLTVSVFTLLSNGLLTWRPSFSPLFISGSLAGTAGSIVMYTFREVTPAKDWVGAEILTSIGVGLALQLPVIANNASVGVEDISIATSLALFFENIGETIFTAATEAAFTAGLVDSVSKGTTGIDPHDLINAGLTSLRTTFAASQLPAVLAAYLEGCRRSHLVPVACGSAAALTAMLAVLPSATARMQKWSVTKGLFHPQRYEQ